MSQYELTQDVFIPAGTKIEVEPPYHATYFTDTANVTTAVTNDHTSHWRMDLDEALELGIIKAV